MLDMFSSKYLPFWMSALSTGLGAYGAASEARASQEASLYNAQRADQMAGIALDQAAANEEIFNTFTKTKVLGATRAAAGASGLTGGSAIDILMENAMALNLDSQMIRYKGQIAALGYRQTAESNRLASQQARRQGSGKAAGIILGGVLEGLQYLGK